MTSHSAVVLLSGGIDSATCMGLACETCEEVIPVHIDYGQQTAELEAGMAKSQASHMDKEYPSTVVRSMIWIDYQDVYRHFARGVAADGKSFGHMTEDDGRSSGYVPMRNLHFIATAGAVADTRDASFVYHGAQGGDEADYPDCRPEFMHKAQGALNNSVPDEQNISLQVPLLRLDKPEVIQRGEQLGVNFKFTYSCYQETDQNDPVPCGNCPACEERRAAFAKTDVNDPLEE